MPSTVTSAISAALTSMIYISEGESPLELLEWSDVHDSAALKQKIITYTGTTHAHLEKITGEDFLKSIQQLADPADQIMVKYAQDYTKLFTLLRGSLKDLVVIRTGKLHVHIFIIGFLPDSGCLAIHTTAIET